MSAIIPLSEIQHHQPLTLAQPQQLSVAQIQARRARVIDVMQSAMKNGVHYGKIPGTPKPTLYKAGAEMLLSMFQLGSRPANIEDLSTPDEIRYRVPVEIYDPASGSVLGVGIGECSSNEEKYRWRAPICDGEFDDAQIDRRREVWKRVKDGDRKVPQRIKQIRTEPSDIANTVLKMAKKRGLIDGTLVVTAASDVFTQDVEDLPSEWGIVPDDGEPAAAVHLSEPRPAAPSHEPAATTDQRDSSQPAGIYVTAVRVMKTSGPDEEKPWKLYGVKLSNGTEYSTLKDSLANIAKTALARKSPVAFTAGEYKGKPTLDSIEEIR